jgi:hypothetical protein
MMIRIAAVVLGVFLWAGGLAPPADANLGGMGVAKANPRYLEYKGKPIFLAGYARLPGAVALSDVRCDYRADVASAAQGEANVVTLSLFTPGNTVIPWTKPGGKYDLDQPNEHYWWRLSDYDATCAHEGVMLNVVIWDEETLKPGTGKWAEHPMNPTNNTNYGEDALDPASGLPGFYRTVPALDNKPQVLKYQEAMVRQLIDSTYGYRNTVYTLGSESAPKEWTQYWVDFVRAEAEKREIPLVLLCNGGSDDTPGVPVDVSAALGSVPFADWDKFIARKAASPGGSESSPALVMANLFAKPTRADLWMAFISGAAGVSFQSTTGSTLAGDVDLKPLLDGFQTVLGDVKLAGMRPAPELIKAGKAYCLADPGREYLVYIPFGGDVKLDMSATKGECYAVLYDPTTGSRVRDYTVTAGPETLFEMPEGRPTGAGADGYPVPGAELFLRAYGSG